MDFLNLPATCDFCSQEKQPFKISSRLIPASADSRNMNFPALPVQRDSRALTRSR